MNNSSDDRVSWDDYFMQMVDIVASRSTCMRRKVGAILVKNNQILATGYNGAPKGLMHCDKTGCIREINHVPSGERHELCRGTHAEQNAIAQAAKLGVAIENSTLYVSCTPCCICARIIINAGITKVIFKELYKDEMAMRFLYSADIDIVQQGNNFTCPTCSGLGIVEEDTEQEIAEKELCLTCYGTGKVKDGPGAIIEYYRYHKPDISFTTKRER